MNIRRVMKRLVLVVVVLLSSSCSVDAQNGAPYASAPATPYKEAISKATEMVNKLMAERKIPGMSVSVGIDGEIIWSEGFGYADVENRVPITPVTKFRIGSVSKTLTASALALLFEQGKLDLDAPVQKYVPSFPVKRWAISTRLVAGHIAGIRHYRNQEFLLANRYDNVTESLEIFKDDTLLFEPGTKYSYSSYGWNLVSAVIEGASGQAFLPFMYKNVFWPLGMMNTVADHTDSLIAYRTRFYARNQNGNLLNAPYVDNSYKWAGGGFLANTQDLVRFGSAHIKAGFLKQETLELFQASMKTKDGEATHYGFGWRSRIDEAGRRWVGHSGGSVGGTAFMIVYPESGVVVGILSNISGARYGNLPQKLAGLFKK
ncbi:MAG: serine hydrolase domain-containing protein [bacterium]